MSAQELGGDVEATQSSVVADLVERLADLERRLEAAEGRLAAAESAPGGVSTAETDLPSSEPSQCPNRATQTCSPDQSSVHHSCRRWTRRGLLLGAAVGAGAVAAAPPAAASTGIMQYGATNNAGPDDTTLTSTSSGRTLLVSNAGFGSALYANALNNYGLVAVSTNDNGIYAYSGTKSALRLVCGASSGPPTSGTNDRGCLLAPQDGSLWWCAVGGNPGVWRMIVPPAVRAPAGPFVPVTPTRVFDSRLPQPGPAGRIPAGTHRSISVANGRNLTTGAITVYDLVPPGAQAVAMNLTAVRPAGSGFLAVAPGGSTSYASSALNYITGVTLANGLTAAIDPGCRQIEVFVATAATDVLIDILGYY
ncbi:MAG: hypothetical protein H6525_08070 [Actinobacteria bacterium]|nr:hypothetical protein [Actinomycetota bacterium]MCB9412788.1 hypothetical protein [Actinomycetota bacterium]